MLRQIFLVFLISICILGAIGFIAVQVTDYIQTTSLEKFSEQQLVLARQSGEGISSFIDNLCKNLDFYAQSPVFNDRDASSISRQLEQIYFRELPNIVNLVLDYESDPSPILYPGLVGSPGFFVDNLKKSYRKTTSVTDYYLVLDGIPSIVINSPLRQPNFPDKVYGHISAVISLARIQKLFIEPSVPTGSSLVVLLDRNGKVLSSNRPSLINRSIYDHFSIDRNFFGRYFNSQILSSFPVSLNNVPYQLSSSPVNAWRNRWSLCILTKEEDALASLQPWLQKMTRFFIVVSSFIILLYSLLSLILVRTHRREIEAREKIRTAEERERLMKTIREREQFLSRVMSSTQDIIFTADSNGKISFANDRLYEYLGLSKRPEKINLFEVLTPADGERVRERMLTTDSGEPFTLDCDFSSADRKLSVLLSGAPFGTDSNPKRFVFVATNISEIKELQARLVQADKMVTLGTMAGGIAHEINNPLCSILGFAKMGMRKAETLEDPHTRKFFEGIHKAAAHSKNIIDNLLKYAAQGTFQFDPVVLQDIIHNSLFLLDKQLSAKQISPTLDLPNHPITVLANESQLLQVFTNILINSLNAMGEDGHISISAELLSEGEEKSVRIRFSDDGPGIPPENLPKIFDPFFTTKPVWSGTGLGLSIAQTIIKEHRGSIGAESEPGKGTTIIIRLPLSNTEKSPQTEIDPSPSDGRV